MSVTPSAWQQGEAMSKSEDVCPGISLNPFNALKNIVIPFVILGFPGGASGITLEDAVHEAITSNPQVLGAQAGRRAAKADVRNAKAAWLPSVDVRAGYGSEHTNIGQLKAAGTAKGTLGKREVSVVVSQLLWDGFATSKEVARRRALLNASQDRTSNTMENVAFDTVKAYLDVLKNQHLVALARQNVAAHRKTLSEIKLRVESGISHGGDLQQSIGRLALARSVLTAREGALKAANSTYERVVGAAPVDLLEPQPHSYGFSHDGELDDQALQQAITQATDEAMQVNPALATADAQSRAAAAAADGAKSAYQPRINLEYTLTRDRNTSGVSGIRNTDALMVVANWNLFHGGADRARVKALSERRFASMQTVADTRRAIRENVEIALKAKATSEQRLTFLQQHVDASKATLESYKAQFRLGRRTLLDMLNTTNELFTARSNHTVGVYDDLLNQYFVDASKGLLVKSLSISAR